ncbi:MAG: hypothetical protein AAB617_01275 [Patescibacteria group bacterium]
MTRATLGQGKQVLELLLEHGSLEGADEVLASGILADIFGSGLDRAAWKKLRPRLKSLMDGASGIVRSLIFRVATQIDAELTEFQLIHFNRAISSENALDELGQMGFRPATRSERETLEAAYTTEITSYRRVDLDGLSGEPDFVWPDHCRFVAVRKKA